jgi:predicted metal-dependent peptidase
MTTSAQARLGELTQAQRDDARQWMQAARAWTIEHFPYLDTALMGMILIERQGLGTVAVDARWRLYYDPLRVLDLQKKHGIDALSADWVHELMHVLRDHHARWDDMREAPDRHHLFNLAGDCLVNCDVADLNLTILDTDVTFDRLPPRAGCDRTMTTEEIYLRILGIATPIAIEHDCGSGSGGGEREWEESLGEIGDGSVDLDQGEVIREETARNVRSGGRGAGRLPAALAIWADEYLEPAVDWRAELRSVVSRRLGQAAGVTDYTYERLARRRVPGYTFPGMAGPASPRVAAVIDTSGSMEPEDISQCLGDLLALSRAVSGDGTAVTVLICDAEVHDVVTVRTPGQIKDLKLVGGGGTDMIEGIVRAAQLKPAPEVVVVLTDGGTPWPMQPPAALAQRKVVALITRDETVTDVPGWITTMTVPTRRD